MPASFSENLDSMERWQPMREFMETFTSQPDAVSDEQIEAAWCDYRDNLVTNCEAAADALMAALSSICSRRPEMFPRLLPDALEPLYMLGIEDAEEVIRWAATFAQDDDPFMGRPDRPAIDWIQEHFMSSEQLIQSALKALQED